MMGSPDVAARNRYNHSFRSNIFEPPPTPQGGGFVPSGKRRDQTTGEMWGSFNEKDLRGAPKTFVPKEDLATAYQKKQHFLSSDVLPGGGGAVYAGASQVPPPTEREKTRLAFPDMERDEVVDTNLRRQQELQSKLFGRSTPANDHPQNRLTPSNFSWHSHPESPTTGGRNAEEMPHNERAYREKCSNVFDHTSPQMLASHQEATRRDKEEDEVGDAKRRNNVYYSDLFGRAAPSAASADTPAGERRCKPQGHAEDFHVVHQDWTDSKTEQMGRGSPRPEHPMLRKSEELHQARIFGPRETAWEAPTEKMASLVQDTSDKTRGFGRSTQEVHQAHLRSSVAPDAFYEQASSATQWEVVELFISGLGIHADDNYVRGLCQGFDLQIVKVCADIDPVRNLCKGRAKVMVRYNPNRENVTGLIRKLEASSLKVEV